MHLILPRDAIQSDYLLTGSVMKHAALNNIILCAIISFNPSASLLSSFFTEDCIIGNAKVLVLTDKQILILQENFAKWEFNDDK